MGFNKQYAVVVMRKLSQRAAANRQAAEWAKKGARCDIASAIGVRSLGKPSDTPVNGHATEANGVSLDRLGLITQLELEPLSVDSTRHGVFSALHDEPGIDHPLLTMDIKCTKIDSDNGEEQYDMELVERKPAHIKWLESLGSKVKD